MGSHRYHGWEEELAELDVDSELSSKVLSQNCTGEDITVQGLMDAIYMKDCIRISVKIAEKLIRENNERMSPRTLDGIATDFVLEQLCRDFDDPLYRDYDPDDIPDAMD